MKIFTDLTTELTKRTIATIGIFDGVHLAHQEIIKRLTTLADLHKTESLLVTLWPHPRYVLNKEPEDLKLLLTLEEKLELLRKYGLDNVLIIPFDNYFASTRFDKFIKKILVDRLQVRNLVVGYNHQFGRDRQGNYESLVEYAGRYGFEIEQLSKIEVDGNRVSSSVIRKFILEGNIELANTMLGHTMQITGIVVHGNKFGRELGFPTANIHVNELYKIIPADGVYAIEAKVEDKTLKGMLNIGSRPTINDYNDKVIEVNFFNFDGNLYEKNITISFFKRIREEQKFSSVEGLKAQIKIDKQIIEEYFNKNK